MKNTYLSLVALAVAAASLSSCSRANYAFNPDVPAYLGTTAHPVAKVLAVAAPATVAPAPMTVVLTATSTPVAVTSSLAARPVAARRDVAPAAAVSAQAAPAATELVVAATPTTKPSLAQRLVLKKVLKRLTKAEARQQNTAGTAHTAAKASLYLGIAAVGLAVLIIGLIVGSGFLDTIGAIAIVVGLIIFIFNNI